MKLQVKPEERGMALLAFLCKRLRPGLSGKEIKKTIDRRGCRVNGRLEMFSSFRLSESDRVHFEVKKEIAQRESVVLYEDKDLIALDKAAGVLAVDVYQGFPVHRLDKETTGVILFAKNRPMQALLEGMFRRHEIHKVYEAVVEGHFSREPVDVASHLRKSCVYEGGAIWESGNKGFKAQTHFERVKVGPGWSRVRCFPKTGRTHQIRVHLADLGTPIVGDDLYSRDKALKLRAARHLLHAVSVSFTHPLTKKLIEITAPLPEDFGAYLGNFTEVSL